MDAPNDLTYLGVCGGGDGARVQDGDVSGIRAVTLSQAGLQKLSLECRAVGLACPATKIMELKSGHVLTGCFNPSLFLAQVSPDSGRVRLLPATDFGLLASYAKYFINEWAE